MSGPLFTVEGATVDSRGRLKSIAYVEFITQFNQESRDRSQHPVPAQPGLRDDESRDLPQLRCWEDKKGAGWVALAPGKSAWFSLASWGSWRLALLLAKLQRDVWQRGDFGQAQAEAPPPKRRKVAQPEAKDTKDTKGTKGAGRGRGRPKKEVLEEVKVDEQKDGKATGSGRRPGRPRMEVPKEVPQASETQKPSPQEDQEAQEQKVGHSGGAPARTRPGRPSEDSQAEEQQPDEHKDARSRLAAATADDLPQLVAEGLLVELVRAKGWHMISSPLWEGERWRKLLEDLKKGVVSEGELQQEVHQKLRRQAAGQKLTNSRLNRQRAAHEQRERLLAERAERAAAERRRAHMAQEWRKAERVPGCTCGLPIHSERCRLFRPQLRPEEVPRSRARQQEGRRPEPRPAPDAAPKTAAERKVLKLENYIKSQPKALQKTLWKRAMLRYHPDKAAALAPDSESAGSSAEVFIEVKRKYDLFLSG